MLHHGGFASLTEIKGFVNILTMPAFVISLSVLKLSSGFRSNVCFGSYIKLKRVKLSSIISMKYDIVDSKSKNREDILNCLWRDTGKLIVN